MTPPDRAHFTPSGDRKLDRRRIRKLPDATVWWLDLKSKQRDQQALVLAIARQIDAGTAEGRRPCDVIGDAADEMGGCEMYTKLTCATFCDRFNGDLELLVVSYGTAQRPVP